jgi:NAD dependent epimerase/dehydratase family enzyme
MQILITGGTGLIGRHLILPAGTGASDNCSDTYP